jgi:ATP-dependent helicase/nuclease subunit B
VTSGTLFTSRAAASRRDRAIAFVNACSPGAEVLIVSVTRGAADDLARELAGRHPATFGLHRFSLTQLAARLAATRLAASNLVPATGLGAQAIAARAVHEARTAGRLEYFAPVAWMPGFPTALARTLHELRMAGLEAGAVRDAGEGGGDLAALYEAAAAQFEAGGAADRATLFAAACDMLASGAAFCERRALVLFDVAIHTPAERAFVHSLLDHASSWLACAPGDDGVTCEALERAHGTREADEESGDGELTRLRRHLFQAYRPPHAERGSDVVFFSAPGEGREAVEVARYTLDEARRGVRFDQMAVLLRSPREYLGLLEHAFARAGIPAWFGRGTRRPHPAGRALLALLSCADENLSATRFAEYLSLAQVPDTAVGEVATDSYVGSGSGRTNAESRDGMRREAEGRGPQSSAAPGLQSRRSAPKPEARRRRPDRAQPSLFADAEPIRPQDDALATGAERLEQGDIEPVEPDLAPSSLAAEDLADAALLQGTVRAPYRWEEWLVESAVIAGRDRWRRLDGLAAEYRLKLKEARRQDPHSPKIAAIERDLTHLEHLRAFALPLIDEFEAWPAAATWGEWLDRLEALVPRVIRQPLVVQRVLAELRPMAAVGPVSLREVREVLSDRLRTVTVEPPPGRYGRVFVGTAEEARGRTFRVVFVPGLAERVFPQKLREDPLLADTLRRDVSGALKTTNRRAAEERLLLHLAAGAALERLYLSYPRIELREARPRVPSFYGLDVMRAITGRVPSHEALEALAARETRATLAWPAPEHAARAVDDFEHDLAVLGGLLATRDPHAVKGRARYLLELNEHLRRSLTERWKRWKPAWTEHDGLVAATDVVKTALTDQRLAARAFSLTALQRYASCPYQFLLAAVYRLEPFEEPTPLQRLDPLTKGALFHAIQAAFYRERQRADSLPITAANLDASLAALDHAVALVSGREREKLAPAVDRVWRDEIAALRKDLRRWVMLQAEADEGWRPERFELSFGLATDEDHDPHSVPDPVTVDGRFVLRGSIDLVERHATSRLLRVTDHKTGKNRTEVTTTINGGRTLQPVLYSLVVEEMTHEPVAAGRLYYCTHAGGFSSHTVELDPVARKTGLHALEVIDRGIELAFLAASPDERACEYCDFRPVCGPMEQTRAAKKNRGALADLLALRDLP